MFCSSFVWFRAVVVVVVVVVVAGVLFIVVVVGLVTEDEDDAMVVMVVVFDAGVDLEVQGREEEEDGTPTSTPSNLLRLSFMLSFMLPFMLLFMLKITRTTSAAATISRQIDSEWSNNRYEGIVRRHDV